MVEGAISKAATAATTPSRINILPSGPHISKTARRLSTLTASLNLATANKSPSRKGARTKSKEEGDTPSTTSNLSGFPTKKSKGEEDGTSAKKEEELADILGLRDFNFSSSPIEKGTGKKSKTVEYPCNF